MGIRLSHSAIDKYKTCPRMYFYHYLERIRENKLGSALYFGSALDEAINELLKTKLKNPPENIRDPKEVFVDHMVRTTFNGNEIEIPFSLDVRYSTADYDPDLIDSGAEEQLVDYLKENGYENTNPFEIMENIQKYIKVHGFVELDETDQIFYNFACWLSLGQKGLMMIEAYENELLPKIKEVTGIQTKVELPNDLGDEIIGYIDFTGYLVDEDDEYACDNKSSSRKYKEDSVKESQQLTIYSEFKDLQKAAYFVLNKKVRKTNEKTCQKCGHITTGREKLCAQPIDSAKKATGKNRCNGEFEIEVIMSIDTQIVKDLVSEEQKDLTFESIHDILDNIKCENFSKIEKEKCFHFGRKCPYYERCYGKDPESLKGLVKLPEKNE